MRDEAHGVPMKFMSWETWRTSLSHLKNYPEEISLCPHWLGEPTIHPQFDQFVEYAFAINKDNSLFRKFKLHTNAVVFGEKRAQLLINLAQLSNQSQDTFNFIHFSIDAHSPGVYKTVKGANYGERVYKNIRRFLEIRQQHQAVYPKITLAFVVQPENAHEAIVFRDYWTALFLKYKIKLRQTYDWPDQESDSLYFRRLNCSNQKESDSLHAKIVHGLGLSESPDQILRSSESF